MHNNSPHTQLLATTQGAAAATARSEKTRNFAEYCLSGLTFYPFAINSCGYVDFRSMDLLCPVAATPSSTGRVKFGSFHASAHRESSVALCKGNQTLFRAGAQKYASASGHA